jgi:hypothetical protein
MRGAGIPSIVALSKVKISSGGPAEIASLAEARSFSWLHLLAGDKATAIDCFQKALATRANAENEYEFAEAELKALGK